MKYFDSLFAGIKWTTISSIVLSVLAIVKIAILTRFLDRADFGHFALLTSALSFIQLFSDFGISVALLHRTEISRIAHASLYWLSLLSSLLIYGIFYLLTPLVATYFQEPVLNQLLPVAGLSIIITAIGNQYRILALKDLKYRYLAIVSIVGNTLSLIIAVLLALSGWGVWSLVTAMLAGNVLMQLTFFIAGNRNRQYRLSFQWSMRAIKPYWDIGKYTMGGELINYFTREIDIILIGRLSDAATLGAYSLAKQLVQKPGRLINQVISLASMPLLPKFQHDIPELKKHFLNTVQAISTVMALLYGLFFIFAGQIVLIVYGTEYIFLADTCRIFSFFFFWRLIIRFNGNLIIATGKTRLTLLMNTLTFPLMALGVIFGYRWGLNGIVWGQVIIMLLLVFVGWYFVLRNLLQLGLANYLRHTIPKPRLIGELFRRVIAKLR